MNKNELNEYIKKAEEGDVNSQLLLGLIYLTGDEEIPANDKEAFKWFKAAAEQGHADAQYNLGVCYLNGQGVKQNYNEAFRWYKAAAEQGDACGFFNIGVCYQNGEVVKQDYKEAYYWYLIAYLNGYTYAEQNIYLIENILTDQQKQEVQKRVNDWVKTHPKE